MLPEKPKTWQARIELPVESAIRFVRRALGPVEGMAGRDGDRHHRISLVGRAGHGVDVCFRVLFSTFDAMIV